MEEEGKGVEVPRVGLEPGQSCAVTVDGKEVALFNVGGRLYAVGNRCPHRGGPLWRGSLEGTAVRCALHGWLFDLATGACLNQPEARVDCFDVSLQDGQIRLSPLR